MQDFRKLKVWQLAHQLTLDVYRVTRSYPPEERFGLTAQSRDAASSISSNIAEGCGRGGRKDFCRFLRISNGSASELQYHLIPGRDLKYLSPADQSRLGQKAAQVQRMLVSLMNRIQASRLPEFRTTRYRLEGQELRTKNSEPRTKN